MFGLTGGIGSGKSTVAARLAEHGAIVLDADKMASDVLRAGSPTLVALVEHFGPEILASDGSLIRSELAARAFATKDDHAALEAITHPAIAAEFFSRVAEHPSDAVIIHDVPLLVEKDRADHYDAVIVVIAPLDLRLERLAERGVSRDDALQRMGHQASDDERRAVATWVIENDGDLDHLHAQVDAIWPDLVRLATGEPS